MKSNLGQSNLLLFTCFFLLVFSACKKEETTTFDSQFREYPNVDKQLWDLFEAFEMEGALRGVEIDLVEAGITGDIRSIEEMHVAGQCSYSNLIPGRVTVDAEFWENSSLNFKEFIVFHELGHCFLRRDHREDADALGVCKSLMRSGLGDCRDNYNSLTRAKFIDELFDPGRF